MRIAIASGKGGTGKTTVAVNLAYAAAHSGASVTFVDCDVDEPNGHLFLNPVIEHSTPVERPVPKVDEGKCTLCGVCAEICQYGAIVNAGKKVMVFPELCHGCGGCALVCPSHAIVEEPRHTGVLETGMSGEIKFIRGLLDVGEPMSIPVISAAKNASSDNGLILLDAPPGTSCPVIESVRGCDYVLLVTEPTPFGLNDLRLAVEMLRALSIPFGVVVNRAGVGDHGVRNYCDNEEIEILSEIPNDRAIAEAYSQGGIICEALPQYESLFSNLLRRITGDA